MRTRSTLLVLGGALMLAAACGGAEFEAGTDASVDVADASYSSDRGAGEGPPDAGAGDDGTTVEDVVPPGDAGATDAPLVTPDAIEEPPPHCGGAFACVPSVPSGWTGPVELYAGAGPAPLCGGHFAGPTFDGNQGLVDAGAATCGCGCGPAQGVACSSPYTYFQNKVTCSVAGTACATIDLTRDTCTTVDERTICRVTLLDMSSGPPSPAGGSCAPVAKMTAPPVVWSTAGRACTSTVATSQVDCPASSVCAPLPESTFGTTLCITQSGDIACPTTGYTQKQLFYGGVADTRGCTPCRCGAVAGASCSGSVKVFPSADLTCDGGAIIYPLPFTCAAVQQPADFRIELTAAGGSCTPGPTLPTGTAAPSEPVTFCCAP
jgi:hypothetical protein